MDVKNTTPEAQIEFLKKIVILCAKYRLSVSSWIRSSIRNSRVGGSANSWHLKGFAVDIVTDTWPAIPPGMLDDIKNHDLHYLIEKTHIHIQAFPRFARSVVIES